MTYHPSQGRVSKRYNRRVRYAYVTRRLKLRIAELEADLAKWKRCYEIAATAAQEYEARAEKAEAELAEMRMYPLWSPDTVERLHKAEAEVERLSQFEIATDNYGRPIKRGGGRESGAEMPSGAKADVQKHQTGPAAKPAAPSLSARKATRKTDSCDGTTHTVVHADGNVCPFLVPRSP